MLSPQFYGHRVLAARAFHVTALTLALSMTFGCNSDEDHTKSKRNVHHKKGRADRSTAPQAPPTPVAISPKRFKCQMPDVFTTVTKDGTFFENERSLPSSLQGTYLLSTARVFRVVSDLNHNDVGGDDIQFTKYYSAHFIDATRNPDKLNYAPLAVHSEFDSFNLTMGGSSTRKISDAKIYTAGRFETICSDRNTSRADFPSTKSVLAFPMPIRIHFPKQDANIWYTLSPKKASKLKHSWAGGRAIDLSSLGDPNHYAPAASLLLYEFPENPQLNHPDIASLEPSAKAFELSQKLQRPILLSDITENYPLYGSYLSKDQRAFSIFVRFRTNDSKTQSEYRVLLNYDRVDTLSSSQITY